eukprot:g62264.t1
MAVSSSSSLPSASLPFSCNTTSTSTTTTTTTITANSTERDSVSHTSLAFMGCSDVDGRTVANVIHRVGQQVQFEDNVSPSAKAFRSPFGSPDHAASSSSPYESSLAPPPFSLDSHPASPAPCNDRSLVPSPSPVCL